MTSFEKALRDLYRTLEPPGTNRLRDAQAALDSAVRAAYGKKDAEDTLAFLLRLNLDLAAKEARCEPQGSRRRCPTLRALSLRTASRPRKFGEKPRYDEIAPRRHGSRNGRRLWTTCSILHIATERARLGSSRSSGSGSNDGRNWHRRCASMAALTTWCANARLVSACVTSWRENWTLPAAVVPVCARSGSLTEARLRLA
jgi:hypothetical protein